MITPVIYILKCGHVMPGHRGVVETLCFNCDKLVAIDDVHVFEWHAVCRTKKCPFSKWTGLAQPTAQFHARHHAQRFPIHEVKVLYERNPVALEIQARLREGSNANSATHSRSNSG